MTLLIVGAAGLGAWLVAAPLRATPVREAPDADIETAEGRARLRALIALATMPDLPAVSPAAVSAASAASAAPEDPASCGEDQVATYREGAPIDEGDAGRMPPRDPDGVVRGPGGELKPPGAGFTGAMHRLDASLRASADPYDRTAADWLDLGEVFQTPDARLDAVIEDALATEDPRAYALAFQTCSLRDDAVFGSTGMALGSPNCARLSVAGWARVDPGNALPWLYELHRADKAGDPTAQHEALERMAVSSRFDVRIQALPAAVARLSIQGKTDLAAQKDAALIAMSNAYFVAFPAYSDLTQRCKGAALDDPVRVDECTRIAKLMFDHSDGFLAQAIGGSLHRLVTGDASWLERAHQDQHLAVAQYSGDDESVPCARERQLLNHFVHLGDVGEMGLLREARAAAGSASAASR